MRIKKKLALLLTASMLVTSINVTPLNVFAADNPNGTAEQAAPGSTKLTLDLSANKGYVGRNASGSTKLTLVIQDHDWEYSVGTGENAKTAKVSFTISSSTTSVTGVSLNKPSTTLTAGGAPETLIAAVDPDNATNKNVTWSSSDATIASVSDAGVVTPLKAGTTTITVTTVDGSKTATCAVTVNANNPDGPQTTTACVLHFDSHGGSPVNDMIVMINKTPADTEEKGLPIPTRESYRFEGWFTEVQGQGQQYTNSTTITTDAILHANWKANSYTPSYTPSSSSSSSSSSETPKTEVAKAQPVIVDGKKYDIGNQKVSGGETNFTVDQKQFTSYIEKAAEGSEAVIPITTNTDKVKAQLNLQNVKDMSDKSISLKVENQKVTYTIPSHAIDASAVANELGANNLIDIPVEIVLEKADSQTIKQAKSTMEAQKGEVIGTPMKFEIKASAHGKEVKIESFNTYVKNSLEVSEKEAKEITTAVIILPDGSMRHVPTAVYVKDNAYLADIHSKTNGTYVLIKNNVSYSDVKGKWYESVANELGSRMITKCLDKANTNTIQGEKEITREEFAALLVNALGVSQTSKAADIFSDVEVDSDYYPEIGVAYEYGIINGVTADQFAPKKTITRQEAMVMLQRAAKIAELSGQGGNVLSFKDASKVSDWTQEAVAFNVENGLIVGSNGEVKPQATITRAESMTATLRLLQKSKLIDVRVEA